MNDGPVIVVTDENELRLKGRAVSKGKVEGAVLKTHTPLPLGKGISTKTSKILDTRSDIAGEPISERVLAFPHVKSEKQYPNTLTALKARKLAPMALVSESLDKHVIKDALNTGIPALDGVDISFLADGDDVLVNGTSGYVVLKNVTLKNVATCIMSSKGKVLILRRSDDVSTYQGIWACVSGYIEKGETADKTALREITEELGLKRDDFSFVRKSKVIYARDKTIIWAVHPFLFDVKEARITLDWEHVEFKWVYPEEVGSYSTVPKLEETLRSVLLMNNE